MALETLDRVIKDVCVMVGDTTYSKYEKFVIHANSCMRDLNIYVLPNVEEYTIKSVSIQPSSTGLVMMPNDFVYYTKAGLCRNGEMLALTLNEDLCYVDNKSSNCDCSDDTQTTTNTTSTDYVFYNYWRNGSLGEFYAYGDRATHTGIEFKYDNSKNAMLISGIEMDDEVIVEYKADPSVNGGYKLVPTEAQNAIQNYLIAQDNVIVNPNLHTKHLQLYNVEKRKLRKIYGSRTREEWRDLFLQFTMSAPKR